MTTTTSPIDLNMTMEAILDRYPSAQRALFQRYHVGGCSSCGFEPTDTLAQVCKDHNILDTKDVVQTILAAHEVDQRMQVDPKQVKSWLDAGETFRFIDVRTPEEIAIASIRGAEPLDYEHPETYMQLPKDTKIVFSCKGGSRSMDVAAYFIGHGFKNIFSMRGGIDAWRREIDPKIPAY